MEELSVGEIKVSILETEHKVINDCGLWERMDNDRELLIMLAFITGVHEMAQAMIDQMCGDKDG